MIRLLIRLLLILCFLQVACKREQHRQNDFDFKAPKVVQAKSYILPPEQLKPPEIVSVSSVITRVAGSPEIVPVNTNVFTAEINVIIPATNPKVIIPNGGTYKSPKVIPVVDSPYAAGTPEVITLEAHQLEKDNLGNFSAIKATHGLNSDEISSLIQDRNANIWIGEWYGGLSRYDGRFLYNYTLRQGLCSDIVNCIFEDASGMIWIGTYDNGVNKFDGKYFTHYSVKEGLAGNTVQSILQDKSGNIWIATNTGLSRFDGRFFTNFNHEQGLPTANTRSMMLDKDGDLWIGTYGGLTRFDGKCFVNYTAALPFDTDTEVTTIVEDDNHGIWFGTTKGLFKYDGRNFTQFTTSGGLSSNHITKVIIENNGDLWIGTKGGGANRYNGKSFVHLGIAEGLANENVPSIMQDKWNNIWLATTAGVCRYEGKLFSHVFPVRQGEIECVLADKKGNVWMGSGTGQCVNKYDGENMYRFTTEDGLGYASINKLFEDKYGNIWFAARGGLDKFDGRNFTHYSTASGLVDNTIFSMLEDKEGNLWFGTAGGLSRFDGKTFTNYRKDQGLCDETIFSIAEDHQGDIWLGTGNNGVCKFDGTFFTHYDKNSSVSHGMVVGMIADRDNNMWFCTGVGVNKFDGKTFTWYTMEQGLSNNIAKNVIQDRNGTIWVGTINGLNRFIPHTQPVDNSENTVPSYFKNYTVTEGFTGGGTYDHSISLDDRNILWIGANDRLSKYHVEQDCPDTIAPTMRITGISLFGDNVNWLEMQKNSDSAIVLKNGVKLKNVKFASLSPWYNLPEDLELKYDNNYLTFQFIGITTNRSREVRYRYILQGLDKNWTSTQAPVAVYNNLPSGKFTFRVKSANSEGFWSDEVSYSFGISPPWWQTTFAYWAYAISLAGMIWMFSWYRSKRLKADNILLEEKVTMRTNELEQSLEERYKLSEQIKSQQALLNERLRISRELHDDIGSTLGSISIYSEVAKKRTDKNENPGTILFKIGSASRELIEKMSDIVWSLNLNNENFDQMQHRMEAFAAMMLAPRNIQYDITVDEATKQVQLTNVQAKNIFLIYKEALHNIVKYADSNVTTISFCSQNNQLTMVIHDNGKGFYPFSAQETKSSGRYPGGNGIRNMYVRSNEMNGKLNIESAINEGTTIRLIIPL